MRPPRFEENDAVFVEPIPRLVPEKPEGFALRVVRVLGRGDPGPAGEPRSWVNGVVLNLAPPRRLKLLIRDHQPRPRSRAGGRFDPPDGWVGIGREPHPWERRIESCLWDTAVGAGLNPRFSGRPSA